MDNFRQHTYTYFAKYIFDLVVIVGNSPEEDRERERAGRCFFYRVLMF